MKYLVWGVIIALVVLWVLRPRALRAPGARPAPKAGTPEAMLQCAECGMHFPSSEAVTSAAGLVFCSEEHRQRHALR